jgi:glycosyltransferase involved in cell wall biosynthesis
MSLRTGTGEITTGMTSPRASIIITTHNRLEHLRRAIASALAASQDAEVIVVDDASADNIADLCASIEGVRYVRVERNQGVAGARNIGLVASRGQFITFLDDDDLRLPNSVDDQIEALLNSPAAMLCYAQAIPQGDDGQHKLPFPELFPQGDIFWDLLTRNFIPCGSVVFRRECIDRVGLLDDRVSSIDDWDFWLRITGLFPVISLQAPVLIWRQPNRHSMQGSSDTIAVINLSIDHFRTIRAGLTRFKTAPRPLQEQAWRAFSKNLAEHLAWETFQHFWSGQLRKSFSSARSLLRLHPVVFPHLWRNWARPSTISTLLSQRWHRRSLDDAKVHFKGSRSIPDN